MGLNSEVTWVARLLSMLLFCESGVLFKFLYVLKLTRHLGVFSPTALLAFPDSPTTL